MRRPLRARRPATCSSRYRRRLGVARQQVLRGEDQDQPDRVLSEALERQVPHASVFAATDAVLDTGLARVPRTGANCIELSAYR
jgi:hypothetical protein